MFLDKVKYLKDIFFFQGDNSLLVDGVSQNALSIRLLFDYLPPTCVIILV